MKKSQLQELIRHITRSVLKEFQNIDPTSNSSIHNSSDSTSPDKMNTNNGNDITSAADERAANLKAIRTAELNLKGTKTQSDYFAQQLKQNKLKKAAQEKELQNLKAGKDISSGGAGSINVT